ncbi:hypothetical protein ACTID9_07665 [Brevibacillus fluminis]|uniref:hypothetical protein n=1 Tax=Brevibacillus fluminis TaxID=511487 RepID=UPI003F8B8C42
MEKEKRGILDWVTAHEKELSDWNQLIWDYAETAWREYRSAAWYVSKLREEGFAVEEGSGGMPTAFCATWSNGEGPVIGGYAEYDAVPGNCQAADTIERPRDGLSKYAGGHTDPHSALGIGSLGGFLAETERCIEPEEAERLMRDMLPAWQQHFTSDDYTEYCWHAPTVRLYIGRPTHSSPTPEYRYPSWVMNALGGIRACIDPMIMSDSKTIGMTIVDLLTKPQVLQAAKEEFIQRTEGGIGGAKWLAPLCDYEPPIEVRWPEYVTTARGYNRWIIP